MIKEIRIKVIPHKEQRLDGNIGDYWQPEPGVWEMRVSDMGDWQKNMLVAVHEFVEVIQTEAAGIPESEIQKFDEDYYKQFPDAEEEAGHNLHAPYHVQHVFAENLERLLCAQLGIKWSDYELSVNSL